MHRKILLLVTLFCFTLCNVNAKTSESQTVTNTTVKETKTISTTTVASTEKLPTVILFYAKWCGYCKKMFPLFETLQAKYKGRVNFFYIDIDSQRGKELALQYRTKEGGIPDTQFYNAAGKLVDESMGALPMEKLEAGIKNIL